MVRKKIELGSSIYYYYIVVDSSIIIIIYDLRNTNTNWLDYIFCYNY